MRKTLGFPAGHYCNSVAVQLYDLAKSFWMILFLNSTVFVSFAKISSSLADIFRYILCKTSIATLCKDVKSFSNFFGKNYFFSSNFLRRI